MKLVVAVFCLSVFSLTQISNAQPTTDPTSPWNYFVSLIGGEAIKHIKMMVKLKLKGSCLNAELPTKIIDLLKTCGMETFNEFKPIISQKGSFGREDLVNAYKYLLTCKLKKGADIDINDGINLEKYREEAKKILNEMSKDDKTKELLTESMMDCSEKYIKGGRGDQAIKELSETEICMCDIVIDECAEENKSPGMMVEISKAVSTLFVDPKCDVKIGSNVLLEPIEQCLQEATTEWNNDNSHASTFELKGNAMEDTAAAFKFIKGYLKDIWMKSCHCSAVKIGMLTETKTNAFISKAKTFEFLLGLDWTNNTEKESVISTVTKCFPKDNDPMIVEMNNMIEMCEPGSDMQKKLIHKKLGMYKFKMDACACKDFINTCGLNNDLAKMIHPILNFDLMNAIMKDFKGKGGDKAVAHIKMIVAEKFDFSKLLN